MTQIQILTDESKMKIRRAIILLEVLDENIPMDIAKKCIKELNEILTETEL